MYVCTATEMCERCGRYHTTREPILLYITHSPTGREWKAVIDVHPCVAVDVKTGIQQGSSVSPLLPPGFARLICALSLAKDSSFGPHASERLGTRRIRSLSTAEMPTFIYKDTDSRCH